MNGMSGGLRGQTSPPAARVLRWILLRPRLPPLPHLSHHPTQHLTTHKKRWEQLESQTSSQGRILIEACQELLSFRQDRAEVLSSSQDMAEVLSFKQHRAEVQSSRQGRETVLHLDQWNTQEYSRVKGRGKHLNRFSYPCPYHQRTWKPSVMMRTCQISLHPRLQMFLRRSTQLRSVCLWKRWTWMILT